MSKKTKTKKLPKRVGGLKVPKELRKSGGALLTKLNTPMGRELLAAGLVAAGAAMARSETVRKAAGKAAQQGEKAGTDGAHKVGQVAEIIGAAASAAMDGWFGRTGRSAATRDSVDEASRKEPMPSGTTPH